jgi:hypothetical protein
VLFAGFNIRPAVRRQADLSMGTDFKSVPNRSSEAPNSETGAENEANSTPATRIYFLGGPSFTRSNGSPSASSVNLKAFAPITTTV